LTFKSFVYWTLTNPKISLKLSIKFWIQKTRYKKQQKFKRLETIMKIWFNSNKTTMVESFQEVSIEIKNLKWYQKWLQMVSTSNQNTLKIIIRIWLRRTIRNLFHTWDMIPGHSPPVRTRISISLQRMSRMYMATPSK